MKTQTLRDNTNDLGAIPDRAALSRPNADWKKTRNGTHGGAQQEAHSKISWYHPFLWVHIDAAARKLDWSTAGITKVLLRDHKELFLGLNKGTVHKWIDKETKRGWSVTTMKSVRAHHSLAGSGRTGVLAKSPDVVDEITKQLRGLRAAHVAVNVHIARSIMLAIIKEREPQLLTNFKCSEVRS